MIGTYVCSSNSWKILNICDFFFSFERDHKLIHVIRRFMSSAQPVASMTLSLSGRPQQSGSRCVIRTKEVKNIMCARSPCGRSGMKGEEGCVFEVTHGFSQRRQINISLALSSLRANSWDWTRFWSSVFARLALPRCPLNVICVWSQICSMTH